ncbi:MAG TPA: hypothetical protein VM536_09340, partial [Chloroflexia bacterium]|nr:hypothetical protein [Chloroflexia bacterium]
MRIGTYQADDSLGPRVTAAEAERERLAALGAFTGPAALRVTELLRRDFVHQSVRLQGSMMPPAEVTAALGGSSGAAKATREQQLEVVN